MMAKCVIGVVGLGTMGLGIALVYAQAGFSVLATDAQEVARASAKERLAETLSARVEAGKLSPQSRDAALANITTVDNARALGPANLVIEAIVEDMAAKRALIEALEGTVSRECVLATNTSSLSVAAIASSMIWPERLIGLHFFNPAPVMRLVELVAHGGTAPGAMALARHVTEAAGKTVIACPDRPGFIVNRCARPYYGEALALLEEGRSASDIDASMMAAGYRIGPFGLIDLIGADIHLAATQGLSQAMGGHPRYHVFEVLKAQVRKGDLGRKSGRGFIFPATPGAVPNDAGDIAFRIEATLANEAASLLAEGGTDEAGIDTAMKLGLNFPRGPFESARYHGLERIRAKLGDLEAASPNYLKGRYIPSSALVLLT